MTVDLHAATRPSFYFIGVTTGKSSIMAVFPEWARHLDPGDVVIKGIDLRPQDTVENDRAVVRFLKDDPLSLGALVTTHKLDQSPPAATCSTTSTPMPP